MNALSRMVAARGLQCQNCNNIERFKSNLGASKLSSLFQAYAEPTVSQGLHTRDILLCKGCSTFNAKQCVQEAIDSHIGRLGPSVNSVSEAIKEKESTLDKEKMQKDQLETRIKEEITGLFSLIRNLINRIRLCQVKDRVQWYTRDVHLLNCELQQALARQRGYTQEVEEARKSIENQWQKITDLVVCTQYQSWLGVLADKVPNEQPEGRV